MEFDKLKVYTTLNADELKVGSKVICADDLASLKEQVNLEPYVCTLTRVCDENSTYRFATDSGSQYVLAYLVSEEKKLKWTDLKLGDVIRKKYEDGYRSAIVIRFDTYSTEKHIGLGDEWLTDKDLENWEKVKNENETA